MRNGKCRPKSFNDVVRNLADRHIDRLLGRARTANRLAKTLGGRSQDKAYAVKHETLVVLRVRFPERVSVRDDPANPLFTLVKVETPTRSYGLHIPEVYLIDRGLYPYAA